ncbi:MAG: hypothetical protein GF334_11630 [Candidatus Altiarchaeales archaeon]|nr:hypothetical protein [Candidatus Altiarchaeales archaeon]
MSDKERDLRELELFFTDLERIEEISRGVVRGGDAYQAQEVQKILGLSIDRLEEARKKALEIRAEGLIDLYGAWDYRGLRYSKIHLYNPEQGKLCCDRGDDHQYFPVDPKGWDQEWDRPIQRCSDCISRSSEVDLRPSERIFRLGLFGLYLKVVSETGFDEKNLPPSYRG